MSWFGRSRYPQMRACPLAPPGARFACDSSLFSALLMLSACSGNHDASAGNDVPEGVPEADARDAGSVRSDAAVRGDAGPGGGRASADASSDSRATRDAASAADGAMAHDATSATDLDRDASAAPGPDATAGMAQDECGPIPTAAPKAAKAKAVVQYGLSEYHTKPDNQFVSVQATLTVPAKPPPTGIIFVWPGTQALPDEATYQPVGGGVLQPVLTWGTSCVPGALPGHSTWWISPVYVNDETTIPDLQGCHGGPVISTAVGDRLDLEMRLDKTVWYQKVVDRNSQLSTEFSIDLRGQLQQRALFWIELKTAAKPTEDLIFEHIVLKLRDPEPGACALNNRGTNDYVTESRVSADGLTCCIDRIVLRAEGVAATTKDPS